MQIIHISERGISVLRGMPQMVKILADVEGSSANPQATKQLEAAEKEAVLAQNEIVKGFPVLHGLAVVALWSWLEHFVKRFLALWLLNRRDALDVIPVRKLRIKLGEYLQLRKGEQGSYLVELLEQELATPLKRGANRFENLLEPFGLNGSLPESCSKALFELQQVRNTIAHTNGRADRRLKSECPWLRIRLGQPVHVSHEMLDCYSNASSEYLLIVLYRVGDIYGHDLRVAKSSNQDSALAQPTTA
jgi:hypothetical protein